MFSRKISLIVAPHGSSKSWNRVVPLPVLVLVPAALLVAGASLFALSLRVLELGAQAKETAALRRENENLRTQLEGMRDLERELVRLQEFEVRFRRWAGLDLPGRTPTRRAAPGLRSYDWEEEDLAAIPSATPVEGWISREFEPGQNGHEGLDIAAASGTPVVSAAAGVVRYAGWDETYGNVVLLDHEFGFTSLYGHNDTLLVKTGQEVRREQPIARLGNTGRSSAPHLHFEVRLTEHALDPIALVTRERLKS